MKVILAKSAGFCFGVDRAVNKAMDAAKAYGSPIYTYGELIHNRTVVEELENMGVFVTDDIDSVSEGTIIIRSHGVGKDVFEKISEKGLTLVDATCPKVKSVQNKVEKYHNMGYNIVIVGDCTHPEVIGVNGWCENSASIIDDPVKAKMYTSEKPVCIVAQTTIIKDMFDEVSSEILKNYPDSIVFNTICLATRDRQSEAEELAKVCDAMIVIGGKNSSNTKKLADLCSIHTDRVYLIESADDINKEVFCDDDTVGITAGASTPSQVISEVLGLWTTQ
ncbi:MAG: 4-hydroxy-3-methylbut-2-enyl diphosphate reductase [Eubacteriaceae bacterium]|nr:4-hydroxy-3-methylbut-2-enyl diphosphate reductase [Eubacteriaceae bacterium]